MAKTPYIMKRAANQAVCSSELKRIPGSTQLKFLKESVGQYINDLLAKDKTLYDTLKLDKTSVNGKARLAQLNPNLRRMLKRANSFAILWDYTDPFIVYEGSVWDLSTGTLAADTKEALSDYLAYKIGLERGSKSKIKAVNRARLSKPATNLAAFNTKMTAIRAGN